MEEIKNVIVEQKDILDIIKSLNRHYIDKEKAFEETERLISLNFGYIPSVARIYTADDFIKEIQDSPGSKKYYYIMNDIDFGDKAAHEIYVASNFITTIFISR